MDWRGLGWGRARAGIEWTGPGQDDIARAHDSLLIHHVRPTGRWLETRESGGLELLRRRFIELEMRHGHSNGVKGPDQRLVDALVLLSPENQALTSRKVRRAVNVVPKLGRELGVWLWVRCDGAEEEARDAPRPVVGLEEGGEEGKGEVGETNRC